MDGEGERDIYLYNIHVCVHKRYKRVHCEYADSAAGGTESSVYKGGRRIHVVAAKRIYAYGEKKNIADRAVSRGFER